MKIAKLSSLLFLPLAFCSTVPENEIHAIADVQANEELQVPIQKVFQDISEFMDGFQRVANDALASYELREEVPDWPYNIQDLLRLADAQLMDNSGNVTLRFNPIQDVINGVFGAINQFTGAINGITSQLPGNITIGIPSSNATKVNATDNNPIGHIIADISQGADYLVSNFTDGTYTTLNGLVMSLVNKTGHILEDLTNGVISSEWVITAVKFVSESSTDLITGKKDIVQILTEGLNLVSNFTGANNPLGKFIQNIAIYLSNNPDGVVATSIKVGTFISSGIHTILSIIDNAVTNLTKGAVEAIKNTILNFLKNFVFGGIFKMHRLQQMARASNPTTSYTQVLVEILNKIIQKLFKSDPYILAVLTDPSEENIRRFILQIAKVLTDHNG